MSPEVDALKLFFAAVNRNDMQAITRDFDPQIVRIEFDGFPAAGTYRCPSSTETLVWRSYSIPTHLNGSMSFIPTTPINYRSQPHLYPNCPIIQKIGQMKKRAKLILIEEYAADQGANLGSFLILKTGGAWGDIPAFFHGRGKATNLAFSDTHVEYRLWGDPRTFKATRGITNNNNKDLPQLQLDVFGL